MTVKRSKAIEKSTNSTGLSTRSSSPKFKKIIWAVEPFETESDAFQPLASLLELWSRKFGGKIFPVSVVGPLDVNWPIDFGRELKSGQGRKLSELLGKAARVAAAPALEKATLTAKLKNSEEARVLLQPSNSQSASIASLIAFAKREKVELIAVNTHGRKGLDRLLLGSFAEGLIASSEIPILTVNKNMNIPSKISTILIPTDFSAESMAIFKKVLAWITGLSAEAPARIILINRFVPPGSPFVYSALGGEVNTRLIEQTFHEVEIERKKQARKWKDYATARGVKCEIEIDRGLGDLDRLILEKSAEYSADLISMVSYKSTLGRALIGSTARDVLLGAKCPVLIMHAKRKK